MKLRLALSAFVYAATMAVAVLVVTGHLSLTPFTNDTQQVMALENEEGGSSLLLCYGCNQQTIHVTVTVTVRQQQVYHNPCQWGCYQQVYHNPCQWGCYQQVYHDPCQWGCYNQVHHDPCNWGGCRYQVQHNNYGGCQW